jgi:hypothetical protein
VAPLRGDRVDVRVTDHQRVKKKNGALTFVVKVTDVTNQHGVRVSELRSTIVVRAA